MSFAPARNRHWLLRLRLCQQEKRTLRAIWRKFCHVTRKAWPIHHLAKTYRLLTDDILQNVSTTDIAESIQPSKFEWENASPQATSSGELHNAMHPGEPSTPRDTWEYRHLKQRLFMGSGRSGSICFTCDMIISLTSFMSISKCSIPNGTLVCARRDGPMSSGSEREIIMLAIFVVRCTPMAFIRPRAHFIKDLTRAVYDSVGGAVKSRTDSRATSQKKKICCTILIDWVRSARQENFGLSVMIHGSYCTWSVHQDLKPNIFPSDLPSQSIRTHYFLRALD